MRPNLVLRRSVSAFAVSIEAVAIVLAAVASRAAWAATPFAQPTSFEYQARLGVAAALLMAFFTLLRGDNRLRAFLSGETDFRRLAADWNVAFFLVFLLGFLTRRTEETSRGAVLVFYVAGFASLWCTRAVLARLLGRVPRLRFNLAQRVLVVGADDKIADFGRRHALWTEGFEIVGAVSVQPTRSDRGCDPLNEKLRDAVELARTLAVDDVYVALPWHDTHTIDCCIDAFLNMPVAIHLAPERILDRFDRATFARVGTMTSLELTRPMSSVAVASKRALDLAVAGSALVLLAPLFAVVALAIKLDSAGPVFFRQTRFGFNQRPFRIVKFRSMTTFADDGFVPQARRGDPRITRVGRWLRRSNVDELPQLLNVLRGEMSIVGPRPHAVPHNELFERRIALYARRHNVRPGITGWAQVNGLRGETDTDDKMRRRIEYDLFYIDNWSIVFDLRIMTQTLVSPRSYRNAR